MKMIKKTQTVISAFLFLIMMAASLPAEEERTADRTNSIRLPAPAAKGLMSLEEAIAKRRSVRSYGREKLSAEQISQLLWSAQGITGKNGLRAAPSAGALYPMEIYTATSEGVFHYLPAKHSLKVIAKEDLRGRLSQAALGQASVGRAPMVIVISAVHERVTSKYGQRGIKYVHIEAGHIAQNIHLQAAALGLGSVPVGAFDGKAVSSILSLPPDQEPVYIIPVGSID